MRRLLVALFVPTLLALAPARAAAPFDWVLLTVAGGPQGATDVGIEFGVEARRVDKQVALVGFGSSFHDDRWVWVHSSGGGPVRVSSTAPAALDVTLSPDEDDWGLTVYAGATLATLAPGESLSMLVFMTSFAFDHAEHASTTGTGSVVVTATLGRGSRALAAADPADLGAAAGIGGAAAGASVHTASTATGIAGGFLDFEFCEVCVEAWTAPDGASGYSSTARAMTPTFGVGVTPQSSGAFAGPAGDWTWSWNGAGVAGTIWSPESFPAYAAYAPIGDAWTLFRS